MASIKKVPPVIFDLNRTGLRYCDHKTQTVLEFTYPPGSVSDMEITDAAKLAAGLNEFIQSKQIAPAPIILILSPDIYFEKNLSNLSVSERETEAQNFLESIPFRSMSSKVFVIGNDYKLVVINRDFYDVLRGIFEQLNFSLIAAVPVLVLNPLGVPENFDYETCRIITRKTSHVVANSFLAEDQSADFANKERHFLNKNKAVVGIITVVVMLGALATSVMTLRRPTSNSARATAVARTPTRRPSPVASPTSALLQLTRPEEVKVQIQTSSTTASQTGSLDQQLRALGFTQITQVPASAAASKTLVLVSPQVAAEMATQVLTLVKSIFTDYTTQTVPQSGADITIIPGN